MRNWREAHSFAAVLLLIAVVSATTIISCGGGDGDTNGQLCEQCGDSDGPCDAGGASTSGNDRPSGCTTDPCQVALVCVRRVDSAQRRCFPVDPSTGGLDLFYRCDGSRPAEVPTSTPVPTITPAPTDTPTPVDTGATSTAVTPTATGSTPVPTVTPEGTELVSVDIFIETDDDSELPPTFSATITYPPAKGSFVDGTTDCDPDTDGVTVQDNGNGTLAIAFAGDNEDLTSVGISCTFYQIAGETLTDADLSITSRTPGNLPITIEEL